MAKRKPEQTSGARALRCAIYTRKSTEEGLEQEFNSLDAQYEACSAYITSQRHEGWILSKDRYDDGGFSGGTMERPGMKRLMADVASGRVDIIVVYKVDRLTRSLADFAKIVEILDGRGASFVSVTQAFNTTTSMGRLTLNVLLSFAQFEREVTGERIRDKIAASKKKGMWMGGPVPLGYSVADRNLVIDETDAIIVRHIFERYIILGTGRALIEELREQGYRTKVRQQKDRTVGGIPFERGMLFHILSNPIYIGKIVHHREIYDGSHAPIITQAMWDEVQAQIEVNRVAKRTGERSAYSSPLAGRLRDGHGRKMTPSHAVRNNTRYRYYITHGSKCRTDRPASWRLRAHDVETAVNTRIQQALNDPAWVRSILPADIAAAELSQAIAVAASTAQRLDTAYGKRVTLPSLLHQVRSGEDQLVVMVDAGGLARTLHQNIQDNEGRLTLTATAAKVRIGNAIKLVIGGSIIAPSGPDIQLIALLAEAQKARYAVFAAPAVSISDLAKQRVQCRHRLAKLVRLSWLSPKAVTLIMKGEQPKSLTPKMLLNLELPMRWGDQEQMIAA